YVDMYDPGYEGEEVTYPLYRKSDFLTPKEIKHCRALYAGEVTMVDSWVGRLLQRLDDTGKSDDTCVIFAADHGILIGEHDHIGKANVSENGLSMVPFYEEIAHIPLLVRLPGGRKGRTNAIVQLPEIMPTILDLAGTAVPDTVHTKSFAP